MRFCDACGTKLEASPPRATQAQPPKQEGKPLLERWSDRRRAKREEKAKAAATVTPPSGSKRATEPTQGPALPKETEPAKAADPPKDAEPPSTPTVPVPPVPMTPRITSRPMKAQELRGSERIGIAGRLKWQEKEKAEQPSVQSEKTTTWRPAPSGLPARSAAGTILFFILHVLIAFLAGAVLLGIAAIVASLTSDGRVALLEARGLPILIAGSVAIIVFSLLRTGPRARGSRRAIALSVLIGFLLLVGAVALAYQPSLMATAQRELDRTLGIFGADVQDSVQRFEADIDQWNAEVNRYKLEHLKRIVDARKSETDPQKLAVAEETFRVEASGSEEALDGTFERMRSHADAVEHATLRAALQDLSAIFSDELSGIKLITRGFVERDQALIQSGNTRFTNATDRALEYFEERVRPLLERGDIDPAPLEDAVAELRG